MKRHLSQIHRGEEKVRRNKKERKNNANHSFNLGFVPFKHMKMHS